MPGEKKLVQERVEIPKKGDIKIDEARGKSTIPSYPAAPTHQGLSLYRRARATDQSD